jgi:hypothetical protein
MGHDRRPAKPRRRLQGGFLQRGRIAMSITLRVLSLGAGVQSTTLALMAAHGEIEMPDCAIFADTQSEPSGVYDHLNWLRSPNVLSFPVHVVTAGSLRNQIVAGMVKYAARIDGGPPFFAPPGGMLHRQCTHDFKLVPLWQKMRELAGIKPRSPGPKAPVIEVFIGISKDEAQRMRPAHFRWMVNRYPLIDKGMSRQDCLRWLDRHGYPEPKKSACTFCPYNSNARWADLRSNDWVAWDEAVEIDRLIRPGNAHKPRGREWYLHPSLQPLDEIKLTALEQGQPDLFGNECEGMCGV